jgi:hypothetical protein
MPVNFLSGKRTIWTSGFRRRTLKMSCPFVVAQAPQMDIKKMVFWLDLYQPSARNCRLQMADAEGQAIGEGKTVLAPSGSVSFALSAQTCFNIQNEFFHSTQ